jgi:hypothetical protein
MAALPVQTSTTLASADQNQVITLSATTKGNIVIVIAKIGGSGLNLNTVTDDKGNTYVVKDYQSFQAGSSRLYLAYGVQLVGGATQVTLSWDAGNITKRVGASEFSGVLSSNRCFDAYNKGTGTGTSPSSASFSPAANGELIIGNLATVTAQTWTAGSGFTLYHGSNPLTTRHEYKLSGSTTETTPASLGASDEWAVVGSSYKLSTINKSLALAKSVNKKIMGLTQDNVKNILSLAY